IPQFRDHDAACARYGVLRSRVTARHTRLPGRLPFTVDKPVSHWLNTLGGVRTGHTKIAARSYACELRSVLPTHLKRPTHPFSARWFDFDRHQVCGSARSKNAPAPSGESGRGGSTGRKSLTHLLTLYARHRRRCASAIRALPSSVVG